MNNQKIMEEVKNMRFSDIYGRFKKKELTTEEAADLLGISISSFYRNRERYEAEDFDGKFDRRIGKPSGKCAERAEVQRITKLFEQRYKGFSVKHFHEFAQREHGLKYGYTWCKNTLEKAGLVKKSKRGGPHRQRRPRKPMAGMMLHQDASTHLWIPPLGHNIDLVVTMDDATSVMTSAFFCLQEGTKSSLQGIKETIEKYGLFCSFYTDRGSHYFYTPEEGGKVAKGHLTQVGRALKQLGIKHIAAYSPEARGRSERMFGTLQGRLPQELALQNITTIEQANQYLKDVYIPRHNQQFSVEAEDKTPAFTQWAGSIDLKEILCIQEDRVVRQDNTVSYNGLTLQIPPNPMRHHFVKTHVEVRDYIDEGIALFFGHQCLGRFGSDECVSRSPGPKDPGSLGPEEQLHAV